VNPRGAEGVGFVTLVRHLRSPTDVETGQSVVYHGVDHIALRVADLREAEDYYLGLFDAGVAFREAKTTDGWRTLPPGATWKDAEEAGIVLGLVVIARGGLHLALTPSVELIAPVSRVHHVNLAVDDADVRDLRQRVVALGCEIVLDFSAVLTFIDHYGVRWEVTTEADHGSNGASLGRWLDMGVREQSL